MTSERHPPLTPYRKAAPRSPGAAEANAEIARIMAEHQAETRREAVRARRWATVRAVVVRGGLGAGVVGSAVLAIETEVAMFGVLSLALGVGGLLWGAMWLHERIEPRQGPSDRGHRGY